MCWQEYLPEDRQQFLRLRRGRGRGLLTAERGQERRSWTGQQSWGETQEQAPVLDHASWAQAGISSPIPSHPAPDLTKRKHREREEGREVSLEMPSPSPPLVT